MGGDFDKSGPGLGLGLRKAIKKAVAKKKAAEEKKKTEDKEAKKKAEDELNLLVQKLFDEMKIIGKVSLVVSKGHSSVMIPFPNEWRERSVDTRLSGKITHSLVVEHMVKKIKEENLGVLVIRKEINGCCNKPEAAIQGWWNEWVCRHCNGVWELDTSWEKDAFLRAGKSPCCRHIRKATKCYGDGRAVSWDLGFQVHREELYFATTQCSNCDRRYLAKSFEFDKLKLSVLDFEEEEDAGAGSAGLGSLFG